MKTLTLYYIINVGKFGMMSSNNLSVEEMWKKLERCGIKRESLEKLHPSPETLSHIYSSIKNQNT